MWGIFHRILSIPHNTTMNLNNDIVTGTTWKIQDIDRLCPKNSLDVFGKIMMAFLYYTIIKAKAIRCH